MHRVMVEERKTGGKTRRRYVMVSETRRTFSGNGRARKPTKEGVRRYESGRIVNKDLGESKDQVMATAIDARVRQFGVRRADADDQRLGSALGRLMLAGAISPGQHAAGQRVARVMSLALIIDDVKPPYGVPVLARLLCASGRDPYDAYDPDLAYDHNDERRRYDAITKVRKDYGDLTREAWEMEGRSDTKGAWPIIQRVVLWDDASAANGDYASGLLRRGLNKLVHLWNLRDAS